MLSGEIINPSLAGRSYYKLDGYCYFELDTGDILKLSYKDCLEVFLTIAEAAPEMDGLPEDRDEKYFELADRLGVVA